MTDKHYNINDKDSLLRVCDLTIGFQGNQLVKGLNFTIKRNQTMALVGESGSGKSLTALAIMRLLNQNGPIIESGEIYFKEKQIFPADENDMRHLRGDRMAMIFQEPMTSLNPLHHIEKQVCEAMLLHRPISRAKAKQEALQLLEQVGIDRASERLSAYPHELSGGQRQRVMIAMALANKPDLLIADEPTTALDVTIQKQILELLFSLKEQMGMAVLFITHDLKIVKSIADHVVVMKNGEIVESQEKQAFFANPQHDYSHLLLNSQPAPRAKRQIDRKNPILSAREMKIWFPLKSGLFRRTYDYIKAVDDIDINLYKGRTLGIVGESGSGKTTLSLGLLRLIQSRGAISYNGQDITQLKGQDLRQLRAKMQIVFQDPYGALSPRMMVGDIIGEGLEVHHKALEKERRGELVIKALQEVGLTADMAWRYPHEFSGGQRQRIAIARALILKPKILFLDEPTSAMDVETQRQLLALLTKLQDEHELSYLLVSHDLAVIRALADDILVMKDGKIIETGDSSQILDHPQHDYTKRLVEAALLNLNLAKS